MLKIRLYEILHLIPFFVAFVFFAAKSLPSRARDETRIPVRRAAEDKLIRANCFMGCNLSVIVPHEGLRRIRRSDRAE